MKRRFGIFLAAGALLGLGGCVYTPGYYARPGVVYDDGTAVYAPAAGYGYGYYAPGYYSDPWCCYGGWWPSVGLNFYGGYYYGGHGWGGDRDWHGGGAHTAPRPLPGGRAAPRGSYSRRH
ncbi:MAG: hypothetical protein ACYC7G_03165 [Rudaea sp.]